MFYNQHKPRTHNNRLHKQQSDLAREIIKSASARLKINYIPLEGVQRTFCENSNGHIHNIIHSLNNKHIHRILKAPFVTIHLIYQVRWKIVKR